MPRLVQIDAYDLFASGLVTPDGRDTSATKHGRYGKSSAPAHDTVVEDRAFAGEATLPISPASIPNSPRRSENSLSISNFIVLIVSPIAPFNLKETTELLARID